MSNRLANEMAIQARLLLALVLHPLNCLAILLNCSRFLITSGSPVRLMYFTPYGWINLPVDVSETITGCFESKTLAMHITLHGCWYVVNLLGMLLNDAAGNMHSIAWKDAAGKWFFPKKRYGSGIEATPIGIGTSVPPTPEPRPAFESMSRDVLRLDVANEYYQRVQRSFMKGLGSWARGVTVTAIHRCQYASAAGMGRQRAHQAMRELTGASRNRLHIRYGWYGTSPARLEAIVSGGFQLVDAHLGWGAYGMGLYLAPNGRSNLSASYTMPDTEGGYHVLLCRIIVRNMEQITQGSTQYQPSKTFDIGVDDARKPTCYIVWTAHMNSHVLPEYNVSFRVTDPLRDYWRRIYAERVSRSSQGFRPSRLVAPQRVLPPTQPRNRGRNFRRKARFL